MVTEQNSQEITDCATSSDSKVKKLTWLPLSFMIFVGVWGFGNVVNGFGTFGGTHVVVPWIIVFILYFLPYGLIVGELAATFKDKGGGVSSWIKETLGPTVAYFCGWIYWVVHMPYISQKPSTIIVAANWVIFRDSSVSDQNVIIIQIIGLAIFLLALFLATRGINVIRVIGSIAGTAVFIMSILFIIMIFTAPALTGAQLSTISFNVKDYFPEDLSFLFSLSILVLAVGGCEKLAPYVKQCKNPGKTFPRALIVMVIMVVVCCVLGTIAMGMMFDSNNIPEDFLTNGMYNCFANLGTYYGLGDLLLVIYALANMAANFAVLIISIDAPLKILLESVDSKYIPKWFLYKNDKGAYTHGFVVVAIIVSVLLILPCFGINDVNNLVKWLVRVNSICMPLRYLFVFIAYFALKRAFGRKTNEDYVFIKNPTMGKLVAIWCFVITAFCCIAGMFNGDLFQIVLNVATPVVLIMLGIIPPLIAKKHNEKLKHPLSK